MFKKLVVGLLVVGLILGLSSTVIAKKTKITYLWGTETSVIHQPIEDAFEAEFPNIDLEIIAKPPAGRIQLLWTWAAAGQLPDIFGGAPTGVGLEKWVDAKVVLPLNDYLVDTRVDTTEFPEWAYQQTSLDGKLYGLPYAIAFVGYVCYDKDAFDEVGVAYPTMDMTWDDLAETMRLMTVKDDKGNVVRYGLLSRSPHMQIIPQFGGRAVDDTINPTKMTFGEASFIEGMQWYLDRIAEGTLMGKLAYNDEGVWKPKAFGDGRYAMVLTDLGYGGHFTNNEINWDVVTVPHNKANYGYPFIMGMISVGYTSENPVEALKFVNWMTTSKAAAKIWYGGLFSDNSNPPITANAIAGFAEVSGGRGPDNWRVVEFAAAAGMNANPLWDGGIEIMGVYNDAIAGILLEGKPVEYLVEMAAIAQEMLDELNASK